ncbi:substrate-binding domain-containing protein [Streptomyces sp. PSKA54]|uniref:Substrate-binding domain-containing protein n=1 Tax=Streptomyces himalayensis subsp. aureolus TaxID=2758039 RepID=A0A7W2CYD5_9ACTN|nr:substrate-binding domain-containing protein [Streptomyces himalayensis]MBA4861351.1 substrate-binding domain-containing protein [Streptomyces himalayensis subsp. aureolus]
MSLYLRRAAVAAAAVSLAVVLASCGKAGNTSGTGGVTIGLLLPGAGTPRAEHFDRPLIEKKIKDLCGDCRVEYANAKEDVATQHQQVHSMVTKGVDVLILDPVDAKAARSSVETADHAGIPVVAYDRLARGPISGYVSFDGEKVGEIQGRALLKAMGDKADGGQIVMMNGSPTDPNSAAFKRGALSVLQGKVKIGKAYDTAWWNPENAHINMSGAISALGADNIDGVYSANDGLAGGVISALKAAEVSPLPPVTGQDADITAVQRIVSGEQYMTVYKPFKLEAEAAAEMAVALAQGEQLGDSVTEMVDSPTTEDIPAVLLTPIFLTADNIKDTVVKDGVYTIDQICTPKYKAACERAGLTT